MGERNVKQKLNWSLPKNFKVYRDRKRMPSGLWQLIYLLTENYLCKCLNSLVRWLEWNPHASKIHKEQGKCLWEEFAIGGRHLQQHT